MRFHLLPILIFHILFFHLLYGKDDDYTTLLMKMKTKFESLKDYSCTFESFSANEDKSASVSFKYYFSKPKLVRMELLTGKYSGTILLYKNNSVRVKPGVFILSLFSFTYPPDHRYVCDYRGNGLHNSDWGYFIQEHIKMLELTTARLLGEETLDGRKVELYELISKDPARSRSIAKEHIWIDKEEDILIRYRQYDSSGKLIQSGYYKNLKVNTGIKEQVFSEF